MNDLTLTLYRIARDLSKDLGKGLAERAADALDVALDGEDMRALAVRFVVDEAREIGRARVAQIEREATQARLQAELPDLSQHTRDRWTYMSEAQRAEARSRAAYWRDLRLQEEEKTKGHIGPKKPGSASRYNYCDLCERCRETWEREGEHRRELNARLREIQDRYEAELKAELYVQWTEELLAAEIALPDGSRTTWGLATVEQHQARRDMLAENAAANMENAARHSLAIDALTASGAPNLAALVHQVVPAEAAVS